MLQAIYDSAWHHPGVCLATVAGLLFAVARRLPFRVGFVVVFGVVLAADALVSGAWSPLPAARRVPFEVAFVILGDLRYFLLLERYGGGLTRAAWLRALAFAFVVPLATLGASALGWLPDLRTWFLFYEAAFAAFALLIRLVLLPRRLPRLTGPEGAFLRALTHFELLQYGLWATADALLARGHGWALALRLTANCMYYGAFLPFVLWRAPGSPVAGRAARYAAGLVAAALALSSVGALATRRTSAAEAAGAALLLRGPGGEARSITISQMSGSLPVVTVTAFDPYYGRSKRWRAVPIEALLEKGLGRDAAALRREDFVLRARDGYATSLPGARLLEGGAHVAIADLDAPGWEPIGPQRADPAPFYLVWSGPAQQELRTHPRPWQLASIEVEPFDVTFPHVRPDGAAAGSPADRGFRIFRERCLACHAVNRSGGRVGPDLNVPKNVLEYRSAAEVRAYIRDPRALRYGAMPPHPDLTERDLDDLVAYLEAMRSRKHDPGAAAGSH